MNSLLRLYLDMSGGVGAYLKRRLLALALTICLVFAIVELVVTGAITVVMWYGLGITPSLGLAWPVAGIATPLASLAATALAAANLVRLIGGLPSVIVQAALTSSIGRRGLLGEARLRRQSPIGPVGADGVRWLIDQLQTFDASSDQDDQTGVA